MPVNIGINIQRSPNRINQQLREAGVEGKFPKLLLDFQDEYYLANGSSKTLANAVTHARSGNAVMTDGYGSELVFNGTFEDLSDSADRFRNIDDELLRASIGVEPQATEFDVLVDGRKIGDISNNGSVTAFDASQYTGWLLGSLTNQTYIDYIQNVLNPYIDANLSKYTTGYTLGDGWSIRDGHAYCDGSQSAASNLEQTVTIPSAGTYIFEFNVVEATTSSVGISFIAGTATTTSTGTYASRSTKGKLSRVFVFSDGGTFTITAGAFSTFVGAVDNFTFREMPALKWAPHNLLSYSEEFDNAAWTKNATTITANATTAPNGTTTADLFIPSASNAFHRITQRPFAVNERGSFCVWAKANGYNLISIREDQTTGSALTVDLSDQSTIKYETLGCTIVDVSVVSASDGWYKISGTFVGIANIGFGLLVTDPSYTSGIVTDGWTADGTSGIYIWGAHLYRSDLGGMVDNPERGDSYVPTAVRLTGSELVTNGTFDTDTTGWTADDLQGTANAVISIDSQRLKIDNDGSNIYGAATQAIATEVGKIYNVSFDVTLPTHSSYIFRVGTTLLGYNLIDGSLASGATAGTKSATFIATSTTTYLTFGNYNSPSAHSFWDNISVRESTVRPDVARYLPRIGHHVYNGSAWVNEGLLAESESRTNLATHSDMSSATVIGSTRTADNAVSPDGTENAFTITASSTAPAYIRYSGLLTSGQSYAVSVYAKAGTHDIIRIANVSSSTSGQWFDLTNGTLLTSNGANNTATIQEVGNGWYRCTRYFDSVTTGSSDEIFIANSSADGATSAVSGSTFHLYGFQVENNATSSSFIPTSGSTVTRAAETFTIPSANLPWPSPNYIGSELITNGTFDSDVSGWSSTDTEVELTHATDSLRAYHNDANTVYRNFDGAYSSNISTGALIEVKIKLKTITTFPSSALRFYQDGGSLVSIANTTDEQKFYVLNYAAGLLRFRIRGTTDVEIDTVSVREIDPLSVSIAMDGRMTYADDGASISSTPTTGTANFYSWASDSSNYIATVLDTELANEGIVRFTQEHSTTYDSSSSTDIFSPDVLVPFDIASRHGSTFVNGGINGVALTENTTPTALVDLSATDLDLAYKYMGTIGTFRVWDRDIGDTGIVEATNPSLEPSLSLTFEGTGTNSFVVNDWSE